MFHCWLGEIPVYLNGRFETARGLIDGEEYVTFPDPFGQAPVYYFGHPETVTLPRYIKGVKNVWCKGTFIPPEFKNALLHLQDLGFLQTIPLQVQDATVTPLDIAAAYIPTLIKRVSSASRHVPQGGAVMVAVSGKDGSQPKTYWFSGTSRMREGTATPAAVGAEMIAQGDINSPGVQAPEACVPPEQFINHLLTPGLIGDAFITVTQKVTGPL
jgi:saccharopine dehydrogenase (NAD+, L-lysine-forming)